MTTRHRPIAELSFPRTAPAPTGRGAVPHWDAVVAGADPAGLACARAVVEHDPAARVLPLEAEHPYNRRARPVDRAPACTGLHRPRRDLQRRPVLSAAG
ncbi:hypothetical protein [Kitasatospora sp. NPDC088134]|uniref:hypothetical protein n=1 Tax=Kitasatospora sp. NPDC088134 TaxID=3364071 RepID=UPI003821FB58